MPWVQIGYTGRPDDATKARLIARTTAVVIEELSVPPIAVNVLLTHVPPEDWGHAGVPLAVTFRERALKAGVASQPRFARSVWARSDGLRLHALDFPGAGPAVIVVPGITSPAETWRFVVDALDLPNRVIVLDARGRGWSDAPETGYALADYADDIAAWVAALGLTRPILLGHSMGARAVAAYAQRAPGTPVVVVDPPMSGPGRPYPMPLSFYLDGLAAVSGGALVESFRATSPGWTDDRIRERIEWLPTCSVAAITESHAHFHDEGFLDVWAGQGPALFVRGGRSPVVLADDLGAVEAARASATIAEVADAGHMIPWDNLPGFVAAVRPWILNLSSQGL